MKLCCVFVEQLGTLERAVTKSAGLNKSAVEMSSSRCCRCSCRWRSSAFRCKTVVSDLCKAKLLASSVFLCSCSRSWSMARCCSICWRLAKHLSASKTAFFCFSWMIWFCSSIGGLFRRFCATIPCNRLLIGSMRSCVSKSVSLI